MLVLLLVFLCAHLHGRYLPAEVYCSQIETPRDTQHCNNSFTSLPRICLLGCPDPLRGPRHPSAENFRGSALVSSTLDFPRLAFRLEFACKFSQRLKVLTGRINLRFVLNRQEGWVCGVSELVGFMNSSATWAHTLRNDDATSTRYQVKHQFGKLFATVCELEFSNEKFPNNHRSGDSSSMLPKQVQKRSNSTYMLYPKTQKSPVILQAGCPGSCEAAVERCPAARGSSSK